MKTITFALLLLIACNLVPDFQRPAVETPVQWHNAGLTQQKSAVDPQWWRAFGSAQLNHLITESLLYNNDLAAARQRVEQARAQAKIAGANLWPSVGLQGDFINTYNTSNLRSTSNEPTSGYSHKEIGQFTLPTKSIYGAPIEPAATQVLHAC